MINLFAVSQNIFAGQGEAEIVQVNVCDKAPNKGTDVFVKCKWTGNGFNDMLPPNPAGKESYLIIRSDQGWNTTQINRMVALLSTAMSSGLTCYIDFIGTAYENTDAQLRDGQISNFCPITGVWLLGKRY